MFMRVKLVSKLPKRLLAGLAVPVFGGYFGSKKYRHIFLRPSAPLLKCADL
jgi:hypothetical protein